MKRLLGIAVLIAVAVGSYQFGKNSSPSLSKSEDKIKSDLVALTRTDFEEYQNLKTMEEKYKKADEILGKIVLVFLADLGVRMSFKPAPALAPNCPTSPEKRLPTSEAIKNKFNLRDEAWSERVKRMEYEKSLLAAANKQEISDGLKKVEIKELAKFLEDARPIAYTEYSEVNGNFFGTIVFNDRKKHISDWILEWKVILENDRMSGDASITLTRMKDNVTFSKENGSLTNFFSRSHESKALFVNVYNGKGYIQIYPFQDGEMWAGNYYEKEKSGQFVLAGQASLKRYR